MTGDQSGMNGPTMDLETIKGWLSGGFHDVLDMAIVSHDKATGTLTLALPYRDRYARLPAVGDYHGGVLAALLDVAGTFCAALAAGGPAATANMRTDYLRPPVKVDLLATARIVRAGRSLIVCDVEATDATGRQYAVARGSWMPVPTRGA